MLKGSNIFGKIEFAIATLGLVIATGLVLRVVMYVLFSPETGQESIKGFFFMGSILVLPFLLLSALSYKHAKGTVNAGGGVAAVSLLSFVPFCCLTIYSGSDLFTFYALLALPIILPILFVLAALNEMLINKKVVRTMDE